MATSQHMFTINGVHNLTQVCYVTAQPANHATFERTYLANWKTFSGGACTSAAHWIISQMPWHSCASLATIRTCSWSTGMIVLNLAGSGLSAPWELGRPDTGYSVTFTFQTQLVIRAPGF